MEVIIFKKIKIDNRPKIRKINVFHPKDKKNILMIKSYIFIYIFFKYQPVTIVFDFFNTDYYCP